MGRVRWILPLVVVGGFGTLLLQGWIRNISLPTISGSPRIEKQFRPIAEFESTKAILISEYLLSDKYRGTELARLIAGAGAEVIVLTNVDTTPTEMPWFSVLEREIPKNFLQYIPISHESLWLRDFGPLPVLQKYGSDDIDLVFADFRFRNNGRLDDTLPYQVGLHFEKSVLHLPIAFEGGNFMTDGQNCLMTDRFSQTEEPEEVSLIRISRSRAAAMVREELGCSKTYVIENSPHEHIDMWLKFTGPNQVLVNELLIPTAMQQEGGKTLSLARSLAENLHSIARQIQAEGIQVKRLPQPFLSAAEDQFLTYANSLIVNETVIVPSYIGLGDNENPAAFDLQQLEKDVSTIYQQEGYAVQFWPAEELIRNGGAVHCVTTHIPLVIQLNAPRVSLLQ